MTVFRRTAPTTERLRADIDHGRTGDKVAVFDPAAAPLFTDDEAAGTRPDRDTLAAAEREELAYAPPVPKAAADARMLAARSAQMLAAIVIPAFLLWLVFA